MRIVKPIAITEANLVSSSVLENEHPIYNSSTGYALKDKVISPSNHRIYEVTKQEIGSVTFNTDNFNRQVCVWANHGLQNGRQIKFSTTGSLPTGITAGTVYYVRNPTETSFNLSTTPTGNVLGGGGTPSGVHTATTLVNNIDPATNPTYWLDTGSTNRWKMFDKAVQSQTVAAGTLTTKIKPSERVDTIPLLNLKGTNLNVTVTNPSYGSVVNRNIPLLTDTEPVVDMATYLYTGFTQRTDLVIEDIPPYSNNEITITISSSDNSQVGIGAAVFGQARDISSTGLGAEQGARFGIDDYSIKTRDAFGNFVITERAFSDKANVTVFVNNNELSSIKNFLTSLRATPVVFIGSKKWDFLTIYGFYKNWEVDVAYPDFSVLSMEVSGLT